MRWEGPARQSPAPPLGAGGLGTSWCTRGNGPALTPGVLNERMTKIEIQVVENGPNLVMVDGKVAAALCRCGHSSKKPYCDGAHRAAGFKADGTIIPVVP